jgi:hypothetical protein
MAVQFSSTSSTTSAGFQNPLELIKIENNRATIEKIKNHIAQGFKVCLFVGRGPAEPLPTPSYSKEIWVSLDPSLRSADELPADRLHLILSGNDSAEMTMVQHLFHKVVVDQSTMKFFDPGIVDRLTSLLNVVDLDTSLVFESLIKLMSPDSSIQDWEYDHHWDSIGVNEEKFNKEVTKYFEDSKACLDSLIQEIGGKENLASNTLYQEFLRSLPEVVVQGSTLDDLVSDFSAWLAAKKGILYPFAKYLPLARQKTVEHLDFSYENVELKLDTPYPFWTRYRGDHDNFFIATGSLEGVKVRNNVRVIQKILQFIAEGKKVCLFIGRGPAEPLPNPENPNEVWVSLDPKLRKSKELSPDRLHLILSCNDSAEMAPIQRLFSKAVVDQSTWKFFNPGIIDRLTPILTLDPESTLIFESLFQYFEQSSNIDTWTFDHILLTIPTQEGIKYFQETKECVNNFLQEIDGKDNLASSALYQEYIQGIDFTKFRRKPTPEQLFDGFRGWLPGKKGIVSPTSKYIPLARQKTMDYLQTRFANVQLNLGEPYPYWTRYRSEHDNFFVAKGPKG